MRTLVVSDLHLGSRTDVDVLRRPAALEEFAAALRDAAPDRLVLLGDTLELRHGAVDAALDAAEPVLRELAAALPDGAEVVLVPGNHDHALVQPWLERRALAGDTALGLEERAGPEASDAVARIAAMLAPVRVDVAYPGLWLRPDVYATHGHYLDRHITVPTVERLAAGGMARVLARPQAQAGEVEDYEAVLGPIYAWLHVVARHSRTGVGVRRQQGSQTAWKALTAKGPRPLRRRAFVAAFPLGIALLNRLGLGPLRYDVSGPELRRAGLRAMGEVCRRLGVDAEWVLFGHTHRAGPFDRDDASAWRAGPDGPRLINSGCWVHEKLFVGPDGRRSPYWPGHVIDVPESGPPRLRKMLLGWEPATPEPRPA